MSLFTAALVGLFVILLVIGFSIFVEKTSERNRSIMKMLLAVIVIGYAWIPFDGSRLFYPIMVTALAIYVIQNEYLSLRKHHQKIEH